VIQTTVEVVLGIPHKAQSLSQAQSKVQGPKHKHTPTPPSPKAIELAKQIKDIKNRLHNLHKAKQGKKNNNSHPGTQSGDTQFIKDLINSRLSSLKRSRKQQQKVKPYPDCPRNSNSPHYAQP
jgi:hypothetical protein